MDHKSACPPTNPDQILIRLSSSFQDILLNNISRSGPKMTLIREDYVLQNLNQSAELNCLPAKGGGRQDRVLRRVLRTICPLISICQLAPPCPRITL